MKAVREEIEQEYYKWTEWTQPVLTSNNTSTSLGNIVTTASTYFNSNTQPYMIMTGTTSTTTDKGYWQLKNKTTEEWLNIKFPYKLKISALSVVTRPNDNYNRTFSVYAGIGGEQIGSNITPTAGATRYTIVSGGEYITDNIFIKVHAQSTYPYFGLQNLQITAQYAKDAESSDYDYYVDEPVYKLPKKIERKYYKYVTWEQPILTSNNSSDIMWVSATNEGQGQAWQAFNGAESGGCVTDNYVLSQTLTININEPINISKIKIIGLTNQYGHTNNITINNETKSFNYSVSDYVEFDYSDIYTTNKIVIKGTGTTWVAIKKVYITAYTIQESTIDDYDFYEDETVWSAFNI